MRGRICLIALACGAIVGCRSAKPPVAKVRIGQTTWTVEVAMTASARQRGLAGRSHLPEGTGMLFVYPEARALTFWMKDCLVPIDIAFVDADLRVVNIYEMPAEPGGEPKNRYPSHVPVQYALEVAGGTLKNAGVKIGDRVELIGVPPRARPNPRRSSEGILNLQSSIFDLQMGEALIIWDWELGLRRAARQAIPDPKSPMADG